MMSSLESACVYGISSTGTRLTISLLRAIFHRKIRDNRQMLNSVQMQLFVFVQLGIKSRKNQDSFIKYKTMVRFFDYFLDCLINLAAMNWFLLERKSRSGTLTVNTAGKCQKSLVIDALPSSMYEH